MRYLLVLVLVFMFAAINAFSQQGEYGKDEANTKFFRSGEQSWDDEKMEYNYLRLENHAAVSGVPLGGIGVGNVQFAPNGRFVRIGMNNIHEPIKKSTASFFSLWFDNGEGKGAVRLVNDDNQQHGMGSVQKIYFTGLFPRVEMGFDEKSTPGVNAQIHAYSSLVAQDVKNSSLPVVFFDVQLTAESDGEVAVAFSMEDFIGRGIRDPKSITGMDGQVDMSISNGEIWPELKPENTFAENYGVNRLKGVRQFAGKQLSPKRATHQNYNNELAVLVEESDGVEISVLASYDIDDAGDAWNDFVNTGNFSSVNTSFVSLSTPGEVNGGSIVSAKTNLKAGESKIIRFALAWSAPEFKIDRETTSREAYWANGGDYSKYYHNYFNTLDDIIDYSYKNRQVNLDKTVEWQMPVLNSTLPDWFKFKLINSAYVIYTNMILNKKGDVTVNEGAMGGLAGTMDQRIAAHPFYQKLFTQLDRSEMDIFADAAQGDGSINHFIGNYYFGIGTVGGRNPTENGWMIDNTGGWIIQLAKDYEQTGDIEYLKKWVGRVYDGMDFLKSLMPEGVEIPVGYTTYDDFSHPPIYSYGASIYLATLRAAETIADVIANLDELPSSSFSGPIFSGTVANKELNIAKKEEYAAQFERTQKDMIDMLWNGRFFSYGCEIDGSGRLDSILFTGQLGGQFVSRYCGWGDVIPMDMVKASLVAQYKISLGQTPDYYAPKVWDISLGKGIDHAGSQCWPFYLESYTGYTGFQAGFLNDTYELLKHIQLVHLRQGYTWCQNLWNPGEITYMSSPVSWFSTDVIAGAGLNIPAQELRLAPMIHKQDKNVVLPLYFPRFWAELTIDSKKKSVKVEIIKTFDDNDITISRIVSETPGLSADKGHVIDISGFSVRKGAVLDLSKHYQKIVTVADDKSVLKNHEVYDFLHVERD